MPSLWNCKVNVAAFLASVELVLLARLLVLSELGCVNTFSGVSCLVDVSSPSGRSGLAGPRMQLLLRSSSVSCLSGFSSASNFSGVSCFNGVPELVAAFM